MTLVVHALVPRGPARDCLTLEVVAARVGLHPVLIARFVEFGLVEPAERTGEAMHFDATCLPRLQAIVRLRRDLGVNLPGVAVILDLVERLEALQHELERARRERR
ncbi:MAG: chaperone modulator CbpM [Vicinamibacteria bacterium]|jgi:MerR family transcriptional regulator/heat shock protein HspR|nr:chaperone modulator CbpM [Vicinamibacteria bacterium]